MNNFWDTTAKEIDSWVNQYGHDRMLECPQIGQTFYAAKPENLEEKIQYLNEKRPGWRNYIWEHYYGNPQFSSDRMSNNLIQQFYHLTLFEELSGKLVGYFNNVFEFGGGFGAMARLFHLLQYAGTYILYDLSQISKLQENYLLNTLPSYCKHVCTSDWKIASLPRVYDLYIALFSLAETDLNTRDTYLLPSKNYLISFGNVFNGISNVSYFEELQNKLKSHLWKSHNIGNARYLIGTS